MSESSKKRAPPSSDLTLPPPPRKRASASIRLKASLEHACAQDEPKGWRALQLGFHPRKGRRTLEFRTAFFSDLTELQGCRSSRTREENKQVQRGEHGTFSKHSSREMVDPLSIYYLTYSWGVGKNYAAEMSKTVGATGSVGATLTKMKAAPEQQQGQQAQENSSSSIPVVKDPPAVEQAGAMGSHVAAAAAAAARPETGIATDQATQPSLQTGATPPQSAQLVPTDDQFTQMAQEIRTLFQHAHDFQYGKGWRARQKGLSAIHRSREFQQESLRDLVVMRASLPEDVVYAQEGPACMDNVAFAWNVDTNHFHKLFQGKRAASNQHFATAVARALNIPTSTAADSSQPQMAATSFSTSIPLSLVDRLLANKRKTLNQPPPPALKDILAAGSALQKEKGWRARELGFPNGKVGRLFEFRNAFLLDLAELRGFQSACLSTNSGMHCVRASNGKFTKDNTNTKQHYPFTISYLNYAWGVGRNYANSLMNPEPQRERMRQQRKKGKQDELKALNESAEQNSEPPNQDGVTGEASI